MDNKHDIAIVGTKETIIGFKALGLVPAPVTNTEEAVKKLYELKDAKVKEGNDEKSKFAIIFIIEDLARDIPDADYKKLSDSVLPAIVPIPGPKGTTGLGRQRLSKMVEQAVGSDIFGDN
jgi:V/A-type H+/Na+-transporting ATPase subunit F